MRPDDGHDWSRRAAKLLPAVALLVGFSACSQVAYPPPSEELRARLGAIMVVPLTWQGAVAPDTPTKRRGAGALSGAGQGAAGSLSTGASFCQFNDPFFCAFGLVLGIAVAPVAALVGAGVGASRAHSEAEVVAAEASLRHTLDEAALPEILAARVGAAAARHADLVLAAPRLTDHDLRAPDFADWAELGADTVLELEVTHFGLASAGHIDPELTLTVSVRVRLLDAADGRLLYMRAWAYRGHPHNYFDMAADEAGRLRAELQRGIDQLTDGIVLDLFVARTPEQRRGGEIPPDTVRTIDSWPVQGVEPAIRPYAPASAGSGPAGSRQRPKWASMRSKAVSMVSSETQ